MRLLTLIHARTWNRLLGGMVLLLLVVVFAGLWYENARFDAFIKGQINIDHARIDANGLTLAQAEADIARELNTDRADITALQQKVAALEAQDAQLEQEIAALQAALGGQSPPPSGSGSGPAPTASPRPTPTPPVCVSIVCLGRPPHAASCAHASTRHPC